MEHLQGGAWVGAGDLGSVAQERGLRLGVLQLESQAAKVIQEKVWSVGQREP